MPRLPLHRHLGLTARWPLGVALTSWRYMWRTTPLRRQESPGSWQEDGVPALPTGISTEGVQPPEAGVGPLFHRRYRIVVDEPELGAVAIMERLQEDPDVAAPGEFAAFRKTHGPEGRMEVGDEYVVRMAGPWDGPVRVVDVAPDAFRLATLEGHLEAGQIEFAAADRDGRLEFRIESWARSADPIVHLLYKHLRMAKEIQLHMWTSFLERVARLAGGRRAGRLEIVTRRVEELPDAA
jgi:hypothetical protein